MTRRKKVKIIQFSDTELDVLANISDKIKNWEYIDTRTGQAPEINKDELVIFIFDRNQNSDDLISRINPKNRKLLFVKLVILPAQEEPKQEYNETIEYIQKPITSWRLLQTLHRLTSFLYNQDNLNVMESSLKQRTHDLSELNTIGIALSSERDPDVLLDMILTKAREITMADAGSLYLVEKNPKANKDDNGFWDKMQLRFKLAQNKTISSSYKEFVMPLRKQSMAGYTALTGTPLNIADAYQISDNSEFQHNRSFDKKMGYRTKSVLCLPMKSHRGDVIGVLQLINRKKQWDIVLSSDQIIQDQVLPFDKSSVELASSLAGQAAVSIENMQLYEEIKDLFEGFIVASVHAIEQRDPTTFGHSQRVAELTLGLAEKVDEISTGTFRKIKFTRDDFQQIKYAALLHDFGKIGVSENVLVKAKKLPPDKQELIKFRFKYIRQAKELELAKKKLDFLLKRDQIHQNQFLEELESMYDEQRGKLDHYLNFILEANEPRILPEGGYEQLKEISELTYRDNGYIRPFLTENEIKFLSIAKGSLSDPERKEIESHVTHTYNFLSRIPWSSNLKSVPEIAYAHHEKIDGTGYPRKLAKTQIPLPSKMMTIADIFDALTAWDRPYKKAVPVDKALNIIESEVKDGKLDPKLFDIFIHANIYNLVERPIDEQ